MHNPSLDELRAERQSARGRIAVVSGKLARANRNAAARQASAARQWVLTGFLRTVVLVVMVRTGGVVDPAVAFMRRRGKQRHWPERTDEEYRSAGGGCGGRLLDGLDSSR